MIERDAMQWLREHSQPAATGRHRLVDQDAFATIDDAKLASEVSALLGEFRCPAMADYAVARVLVDLDASE